MQLLCVLQQQQTHCLAPYMNTSITDGDSIPIPSQQSLSTMQQLASVPTLGKKWKLKLKIRLGYETSTYHSPFLIASFIILFIILFHHPSSCSDTLTCSARSSPESIPFSSFSFISSVLRRSSSDRCSLLLNRRSRINACYCMHSCAHGGCAPTP